MKRFQKFPEGFIQEKACIEKHRVINIVTQEKKVDELTEEIERLRRIIRQQETWKEPGTKRKRHVK